LAGAESECKKRDGLKNRPADLFVFVVKIMNRVVVVNVQLVSQAKKR
jgi:hypothetical protein